MRRPIPAGELRGAALLAEICLRVESARAYGLISSGPEIDTERCEDVLAQAREHGIAFTEAEVARGARDFLADYDAQAAEGGAQ